MMGRENYAWREVCVSALQEADPIRLIARIEHAVSAIERRHAEWGSNPGTSDELRDIRRAISGLESLLREKLGPPGGVDVPRSAARGSEPAPELQGSEFDGQVKRLLAFLRSTRQYGKEMIHKSK
jgi:hypothetical protein